MIPWLILGAGAIITGALGAEGHSEAKQTNAKALEISQKAERIYDDAKKDLEISQIKAKEALVKYGKSKNSVMDNSMQYFLKAYEYIKEIRIETVNNEEISKFSISPEDIIEIRKLEGIYKSAFVGGATGATAGAAMALAASGTLPILSSMISVGAVGSAFTLGASFTPLSAVIGPAVFVSGLSAAIKADENLEKAEATYEEANAAVEKMKVSKALCVGITDRVNLFDALLKKLNYVFSGCVIELNSLVERKTKVSGKVMEIDDFTEEEIKLIAISRALAGAVKSVIDTPILSEDGELTRESKNTFDKINNALPEFYKEAGINGECELELNESEIEEFVSDLLESIYEFKNDNFENEDEELYEYDDSIECDPDDYNDWGFETKAKAKVACKDALILALSDTKSLYEEEKEELIELTETYYQPMKKDIAVFFETIFFELYKELINVHCTEPTKSYLEKKLCEFPKAIFYRTDSWENVIEKECDEQFEKLVEEKFNIAEKNLLNQKELFEMCEYEKDDDEYSFSMDYACDFMTTSLANIIEKEEEDFPESVCEAYDTIKEKYVNKIIDWINTLTK